MVYDSGGLYLIVNPAGSRLWRFRYRYNGKENLLSLGVYPIVGLKDARAKRDETRKLLAAGIDPSAARKSRKAARGSDGSVEAIAREWQAKFSPRWAPEHAAKVIGQLERDVFPYLGRHLVGARSQRPCS
jgi:Arm domain-containing DNA-binding protein/integrase-like protein